MGCKQRLACENNKRQNFIGRVPAWTQCRPEAGAEHSGKYLLKCFWSFISFYQFVDNVAPKNFAQKFQAGGIHKPASNGPTEVKHYLSQPK